MFEFGNEEAVLSKARQILRSRISTAPLINHMGEVEEYLRLLYSGKEHEEFHVLFINASGKLVGEEMLGRGDEKSVDFNTKELLKAALKHNAESVVLSHNHPGGDSKPSIADIHATQSASEVLSLLDIRLLDHYVVGQEGVLSIRQHLGE